jgi:hypothetical protein
MRESSDYYTSVMDFVVISGFALIFLLLSWGYGRALSVGRPLNRFKKSLLGYAFVFVLGMGYIMVLVADPNLAKKWLLPAIGVWSGLVGFVAWWRYRRGRTTQTKRSEPIQS